MVESFDKMQSTGEGNGKLLQYSCLENPVNTMGMEKKKKKARSYLSLIASSKTLLKKIVNKGSQ